MEFPDLGEHCHEPSCKRLDFLPMKCDACKLIFCKDHIHYRTHSCTESYRKDNQVPTCPLCNAPVPTKRGEVPDVAVGAHIDNECRSEQAQQKRGPGMRLPPRGKRAKKNSCSVKKCKQVELVPIKCSSCNQNFCLRHRHMADHDCPSLRSSSQNSPQISALRQAPGSSQVSRSGQEMSAAGAAALRRQQQQQMSNNGNRPRPSRSSQNASHGARSVPAQAMQSQGAPVPSYSAGALQGGMSEEEAIQLALALSLADSNPNLSETMVPEQNRQQQQRQAQNQRPANKPKESCHLS